MTQARPPNIAAIRDQLARHDADHSTIDAVPRRAAVAAIFRGTDLLFIKRAEKAGDPWSGQMAFPGGHIDPEDASPVAAAVRETVEEIGLDLDTHGRLIGAFDPVHANPRGRNIQMVVAPYVFELEGEPPPLTLNHEVHAVYWAPIEPMLRHENLSSLTWDIGGDKTRMPGYDIGGGLVWGLTFRMLQTLFGIIHPPFQPVE